MKRATRMMCVAVIVGALTVMGPASIARAGTYVTADYFGVGDWLFKIEFVHIGNPGNDGDPQVVGVKPVLLGGVDYAYRIGQFEVSEEMIENANVLGELEITKNDRGLDKPATSVSWNEAARFVNWLNKDKGYPPAYKFDSQPGGSGYDANENILLWGPADPGYDPDNLFRNANAYYFLPSIDEWVKAGYYDPSSSSYFEYPTGNDTPPIAVASGTTAGTAVYNQTVETGPADITLAGGLSPYGTMGQGGNVFEWQETEIDLVNDLSFSLRWLLGGSWSDSPSFLLATPNLGGYPIVSHDPFGFRVASVPEPATLTMLTLGGLAMFRRRHSCGGQA